MSSNFEEIGIVNNWEHRAHLNMYSIDVSNLACEMMILEINFMLSAACESFIVFGLLHILCTKSHLAWDLLYRIHCSAPQISPPWCLNLIAGYDTNRSRLALRHRQRAKTWQRGLQRRVGGGVVMEGNELKGESHKIARGDPAGQSGPFVCACACLCGGGK